MNDVRVILMLDPMVTHYIPGWMPKKVVPDPEKPGHSAPIHRWIRASHIQDKPSEATDSRTNPRSEAEVHLELDPPHCLLTAISRYPMVSEFVAD